MFVRGLFGEGLSEETAARQRALLAGAVVEVAPVFLKREYRFDLTGFASALENRVRSTLRSDTRLTVQLPREGDRAAMQAGFVRVLHDALTASGINRGDRLIVVVDGLDELHDAEGGSSALDYIPAAADLPDNVTLLLTSRPPEDCPPWMCARLAEGFAPGHEVHRVGVDDPGYLDLLRFYVGRHSGVAQDEPEFEEVFQTILDRSGSLFLFVSFLCDLIREGATTDDAGPVPVPA